MNRTGGRPAQWHTVDVPEHLRSVRPADIERGIYFLDERIRDFTLTADDGRLTAITIALSDDADPGAADEVREKLIRSLDRQAGNRRRIPQREVWTTDVRAAGIEPDMYGQLERLGSVFRAGEGQVAIGYPMTKLVEYFDQRFRAMATGEGADEYVYPTMIPTSVIARCGYFDSFPNFVFFVNRLRVDLDSYDAFTERQRAGADIAELVGSHYEPTAPYCLPPAMCYHVYDHLAGMRLADGARRLVTCRGKSFRHESRYERGLERLWDFSMREVVFFGDLDFAKANREKWSEATRAVLTELGLEASCGVANDPFFASEGTEDKVAVQILMESKYEVRMRVSDVDSIAVASFNYVGDFFSRRFDLTIGDGVPVRSGCAAFGLERLAFAFLCQYGLDESAWPTPVREFDQ